VNDKNRPDDGPLDGSPVPRKRRPQLAILVVLLFIELLLVSGAAVYLVIELLIDTPVSYASAIAILALTVLAAVWMAIIIRHTLRGRSWTRGATIVWQVLQASVGLGALQGIFARPDVGWPLIILSLATLVMLFTKPVLAATAQEHDESV
jgi:hypothetical protein